MGFEFTLTTLWGVDIDFGKGVQFWIPHFEHCLILDGYGNGYVGVCDGLT